MMEDQAGKITREVVDQIFDIIAPYLPVPGEAHDREEMVIKVSAIMASLTLSFGTTLAYLLTPVPNPTKKEMLDSALLKFDTGVRAIVKSNEEEHDKP